MRLLLLTGLLVAALSAQAQQVTGRLLAADGQGIPGAAVMSLSAKDSSMVEGTLTDDNGTYVLKADTSGKTILRAQALDYATKTWLVKGDKAGAIKLTPKDATVLKTVEVTGQRPLLEIHPDKMVVNVAGSINQTGNTALDVLRKSPGVVVDKDDNLQLKGKTGIRVLIDGKPAYVSGQDLANYLKSLQAADIENIELITNPSAKYEAQGSAGVINIRLKKNRNFGMNGSASGTFAHGVFNKFNEGLNLNYRNRYVNVFGNVSGWQGHNRHWFDLVRTQADSVYSTSAPSLNNFNGYSYKAGTDFFISSRHTVGVMANGSAGNYDDIRDAVTQIFKDAPGAPVARTLVAPNKHDMHRSNINANLNYRYADTSGHELTADLDYGFYGNYMRQRVENYYLRPEETTPSTNYVFRTQMPVEVNIKSAKTDYEQKLPFIKGGSLSAGARVADVVTNNNFQYFDSYTDENNLLFNTARSNYFTYQERVSAGYFILKGQINSKISYQGGLRGEHTFSRGHLTYRDTRPDSIVTRRYFNVFPSAGITFNPSQSHTFSLTYRASIDRPDYQSLNPFEYNLDQLSAERGNPRLNPSYTNNYELSYGFKGMLMTSLGYSNLRDIIGQGAFIDPSDVRKGYVQTRNIGSMDQWTVSVSSPTQIRPWWQGNISLTGYYQTFTVTDTAIKGIGRPAVFSYNGYFQQVFTIRKKYKAEISGWYNAPNIWGGTFRNAAMGGIDIGVQKSILQDRGNIKIQFTDVFRTMRWHGESNYNGVAQVVWGRWESQQIRVSFDYRFGSDQIKGARQRRTAADELGGRVK